MNKDSFSEMSSINNNQSMSRIGSASYVKHDEHMNIMINKDRDREREMNDNNHVINESIEHINEHLDED